MVIEMKKTVSMLLAILVAAISLCTLATSAFADTTTTTEFNPADPTDSRLTTTEAPTTATTAASTTATTQATTQPTTASSTGTTATTEATTDGTTEKSTAADVTATRKPGETYIDDSDETTKPTTSKKPASVDSVIPSTGSSIAVPAIALLALAASTVAVIKTKKDN